MKSTGETYLEAVYQRFLYLGTWMPNASIRLGDVGVQQKAHFKQMTTLQGLGIPFRVRSGTNAVDFSYTSQAGLSFRTKAKGDVAAGTTLPLGEAGIALEFSQRGAFVFQAADCLVNEIEDKAAVGEAVIKLFEQGRWDAEWTLVDTIVEAATATIIVSNSESGALELIAKTPVQLSELASVDAELTLSSQSGDIIRFIAAKGLTPLFRLSRVKKSLLASLFGGSKPITFGGAPAESRLVLPADEVFETVAPEP
jgi:hypothetical protein